MGRLKNVDHRKSFSGICKNNEQTEASAQRSEEEELAAEALTLMYIRPTIYAMPRVEANRAEAPLGRLRQGGWSTRGARTRARDTQTLPTEAGGLGVHERDLT